jgi:ABC-type dipeptide/oligopeptide/nickel transport system permease subunit
MSDPERAGRREDSGPGAPLIGAGTDSATLTPSGSAAATVDDAGHDVSLVHEYGLEIESRSQWAYARKRFFRHRLAMASLVVLVIILLAGIFANVVAPYSYDAQDFTHSSEGPTMTANHYFGTDFLGRDYFSRVVFGIRTSEKVAFLVAIVSTLIGTLIGAVAGYYGGWIDNLLMRITDLVLTLPALAVLLTAAAFLGNGDPIRVAFILALLFWTGLARIVRGSFLSLREKEYVEAAKAAGSGDLRIMFRHMLPNAIGPIVVNATLVVGVAILTEAALSFLGFGVQPPTPALGQLISDGQNAPSSDWWLVTFPGLTIVLTVLCINFIGDGLRDALDPTQRRTRA